MTAEVQNEFIKRINSVEQEDKAKFGKMNVNQMICHCTDQLRMAYGEINGVHRENIDFDELKRKMACGETLPTVDGLDQAAGQGTIPGNLENDKAILIKYLERFMESGNTFPFHFHPFLGDMDKEKWNRLIIYHLNHHLDQFGR